MLDLRDISKTWPDGKGALRGVSLSLASGIFGLLGPNGAGKTTLLSVLVLAVEPSGGEVLYDGLDARRAGDRARIRASIGYLPQEFAPVPHLTGREYLDYCARLRSVPLSRRALAERVDQLLDAVDLLQVADRASGGYSGGMQRRLGVAQALIHAPRLVIVDEPTAGLDPEERIRFRNLIAQVAESVTVLLSTHICEDIEATCDRVGILVAGRMQFDGLTAELIAANGKHSLEAAYRDELLRHGMPQEDLA
jgi:ABC-type multidrug transport system ATPase subunit